MLIIRNIGINHVFPMMTCKPTSFHPEGVYVCVCVMPVWMHRGSLPNACMQGTTVTGVLAQCLSGCLVKCGPALCKSLVFQI